MTPAFDLSERLVASGGQDRLTGQTKQKAIVLVPDGERGHISLAYMPR